MKNKKTHLLIALVVALALSIGASLGLWINNVNVQGSAGEPTLIGWNDEADYGSTLGGYVEIPAVQITYGGETKDAEVIVTKPDGEAVKSSKVKLTIGGIYTIEFRAVFGGKVKSIKKEFRVDTPLFTTDSTKTTWEYGVDDSSYNTGKTGIKVRLSKDDTLTYNEIIDLSKSDGQIIDFFLLPEEGIGTKDLRKIVITLTDLYNPNTALTIILQCADVHGGNSGPWWLGPTYVLAGGQNQTPVGIEGNTVHVGNNFGGSVTYSFYGTSVEYPNGKAEATGECTVGKKSLAVVYDMAKNAVKVNGVEIIKLDKLAHNGQTTFADPWYGFTTGEVKMTIRGEDYSRPFANMIITKIGANDITKRISEDNEAPEITVDFDGYDENNLPKAGKGYKYPIFNATAKDKVFGEVPVRTTVYYAYGSSNSYQVPIVDGYFATEASGTYTIEYIAYDGYKNESKKLVRVECAANPPAVMVSASGEYVTECGTGELIFPAEIVASGGTGELKTYATAKINGEEFAINEGFRPEQVGVYTISLYAEDLIKNVAVATYELTVSVNNDPVFIEEAILPRYFLAGYKYVLPSIPVYDYSSGTEREQIETSIAVIDSKDGGEPTDLTGNEVNFASYAKPNEPADANRFATVIYKATGAKGSNTHEYIIPIVDGWRDMESYSIEMKNYFYGTGITTSSDAESVKVSTTTDTTYTFVNPVLAHGFETKFAITNGGFENIQLIFEDSEDPTFRFTVEFERPQDQTQDSAVLKINGEKMKVGPVAGFDNGENFHVVYDDKTSTLQVNGLPENGVMKQIITNADGSAIGSFPSGKMYFSVKVSGVVSASEVAWKNVGGQVLSDSDIDGIAPSIKINGDFASKYEIGTIAEVYSAIAADVFSPEVYVSITVRDPDGNVAKDVDGVVLDGVPFDRAYFIKLEKYGTYSIKYSAEDWMENPRNYPRVIDVTDDAAPELTLQGEVKTELKQGKKMKIPSATATDNVDAEVKVYAYLVDPAGKISKVEMGEKVLFDQVGIYQLRYMTIDAFGNINIIVYEITVA